MTDQSDRLDARSGTSSSLLIFGIVQLLLVGGTLAWGAWSISSRPRLPEVPQFRTEPITIRPLFNEPTIISDADLERVLWILRPQLRSPQEKINYIDHALRMWGPSAYFDDPKCLSGLEMLETMLDHRQFRASQGDDSPPLLIKTDGGVAVRTQEGSASVSHVDHTIAGLGEIGVPLDYPVLTETGETTVAALLSHAVSDFSLNQTEYEWSALAFAQYLEPIERWSSKEGQTITFDRLADRLMRQRLREGVCRGNHRVHSLVMLLRIDEIKPLLSPAARTQVLTYLRDVTDRLIVSQHADGYWEKEWPGVEWDGPQTEETSKLGIVADRLLITGHVMEWWALAPPELLPPLEVRQRAARWLVQSIDGLSPGELKANYTFLTHAGRALALWRGKLPAEVIQGAPSPALTSAIAR